MVATTSHAARGTLFSSKSMITNMERFLETLPETRLIPHTMDYPLRISFDCIYANAVLRYAIVFPSEVRGNHRFSKQDGSKIIT